MIAALALLWVGQADGTTSPYFPMVPKSEWVYQMGGQLSGQFTLKSLEPKPDTLKTDGTTLTPFQTFTNGELTAEFGYEISKGALSIVSGSNGLPIPPRKVVVFTPNATWDYYMDSSGIVSTPAIHVMCSTKSGGMQSWLGKDRDTIICTSELKLGNGKMLDVFQISTYAKDLGLVKFIQTGHRGSDKVDSSQTLIKYTPGKSESKDS